MRFAFADPPYIGQAKAHYSHDPQCAEVDHDELLHRLYSEYDAWALSASSPSLRQILSSLYCPDDVRVCAWVKPFASFKPGVNPGYAWEPIITWHGRQLGRDVPTVVDFVSANITLQTGLHGTKPEKFCYWLFEFMGLQPNDEFYDLYPGTYAVTKAWEQWRRQRQFTMEALA